MATFIQLDDPGREETPPRLREDLRQRHPRAAAITEFGTALTALKIKQRSAAQWFRTSERNIRRWTSGTRRTPTAVMVTVRLMLAGKVGPADVELAAISAAEGSCGPPGFIGVSARTNGHAKPRLPAPHLVGPELEPEPTPEPPALTTAAAQILALGPGSCRWPIGDPQRAGFSFCGRPTIAQPYCEQHRAAAYLAPPRHATRSGFVLMQPLRPSAPLSRARPAPSLTSPAAPLAPSITQRARAQC